MAQALMGMGTDPHICTQTAEAIGIREPYCLEPHPAAGPSALVHSGIQVAHGLRPQKHPSPGVLAGILGLLRVYAGPIYLFS